MTDNDTDRKLKFEELFKKHYSVLCLTAFSIVKDKDISKDIVQEFFVSFWQKKELSKKIIYFKSYSSKAVTNLSLQHVQKHKREQVLLNSLDLPKYLEQKFFTDKKSPKMVRVKKLLKELPEKRRNIFLSFVIEGKSYSEIAQTYNISINTVKTQMKRAYSYLRIHSAEDIISILLLVITIF